MILEASLFQSVPTFAKFQMAFFYITVNFIITKSKRKHLVCLSFLWSEVFMKKQEEIFTTYS